MSIFALTAVTWLLAAATPPEEPPDVAILASVRASELTFHHVPDVVVTFRKSGARTVWETDRENLPDTVQPRVIYRDIGVRLTITSTLENIEEIVDQALGIAAPESQDE